VGTVKEAGEKSRARERRRDNKRKGTWRAREGHTKTERVGKDERDGAGEERERWAGEGGGREEKRNVVERRRKRQMDKREG